MPDIVRLTYSAYDTNLKTLINGKPVSQFSPLVQFMNEPLYRWSESIFDYIDGEIEGDYALEFIGRQDEFEVVSHFSEKHPYCIGKSFSDYPANSNNLQKRMSELNRIIKDAGIPITQSVLHAAFFVASSAKDTEALINKLDVANKFCRLDANTKIVSDMKFDIRNDCCNFVITHSPDFMSKTASYLKGKIDFSFVLLIGQEQRLIDIDGGVHVYETTLESFYDTIFKCLLLYPLAEEFKRCCYQIISDNSLTKVHSAVLDLLTTDYKVIVELHEEIELGTSIPIKVETIPHRQSRPALSFICKPEGVVECTSLMLKGTKEGCAEIFVFADGDSRPIQKKLISVIRRIRIESLMLSEASVYIGEGDDTEISVSYAPINADNAHRMTWSSDNPAIASVGSNGRVKAISCGHCRITCSAERVSSVCTVYVRPYAADITISPEPEGGVFRMMPNTSIQLHCKAVPENAIDSQLCYETSDAYIANIIQGEITARQEGQATISISCKRTRRHLTVIVEPSSKKRITKGSLVQRIINYLKSMFRRS